MPDPRHRLRDAVAFLVAIAVAAGWVAWRHLPDGDDPHPSGPAAGIEAEGHVVSADGDALPPEDGTPGPEPSPPNDPHSEPDDPPGPGTDPGRPYAWTVDATADMGATVVFVRGLSTEEVLGIVGQVRDDVGSLNGTQVRELAWELMEDLSGADYELVPVVSLDDHDGGVVLYTESTHLSGRQVRSLSRRGVAASYSNTVNGDDHILVAQRGRLLRNFDPFLDQSWDNNGPLPEEEGLDLEWDTVPAAWTLLDRLTSISVTEEWMLEQPHPTYVLR